jgi:hypothetical protein
MRRIRTTKLAAGPKGVVPAGTLLELSDEEAKARVDAGNAEYITRDAEPRVKPIEMATAEPQERTVSRGRMQRRRTGAPS